MEAKILLPILIASVLIFSLFISYLALNLSSKKVDMTAEIAKLNPDEATVKALKSADCKSLEKSEKVWTVKDCKGDVYFKLFLAENGYTLGYCTSWQEPREAFLKLKDFLSIKECVNQSAEDKLLLGSDSHKVYEVCGLKILFNEECILGVRR
jgi:hypothetical protein